MINSYCKFSPVENFENTFGKEAKVMFEYVIFLILGFVIGYFISTKLHKSNLVGTLQIIESDEIEQPYIFLELDKDNIDEICEMKYVHMRVKNIHQNSHE